MRRILAVLIVVGLMVSWAGAARAEQGRLNILFVIADDLGWRDLGCYGSTFYETPHLDRLAKAGMKFTSAYSACQVCSPTRAAAMTGLYPPRTGVTDFIAPNGSNLPGQWKRNTKMLPARYSLELPLEQVTFAEMMKPAGYATYFVGKWHLGGKGHAPTDQGFEVNVAGAENGGPYGKGKYFHPFDLPNLESKPGDYLPTRLAEESVKLMKQVVEAGKPFVLYHAMYSVHTPLMAPEEVRKKYAEKAKGVKRDGPELVAEGQRQTRQVQDHAVYGAMVEGMDDAVGIMLKGLEELGIAEKTVVIFTSDNGGLSTSEGSPTSNVPLRGGKGWMYEGGVRVPLIVRWPGVTKAGSVSEEAVSTIDFTPTFLEAAGVKATGKLDGVSLLPALRGEKLKERALYWHYPHYGNQGGWPSAAVREGEWKLIEWYSAEGKNRVELYNLSSDLSERRDLASAEPGRVESMRKKLAAWREDVGAKYPTVNDRFDAAKGEKN